MARIKFEESIREKLQERELQPSKEGWAKLESQLENKFPERKGNRITWMAIAASITGIVMVLSYFFFGINNEQPIELVVDQNVTPDIEVVQQPEIANESNREVTIAEEAVIQGKEDRGIDASEEDVSQKPVNRSLIEAETNKGDGLNSYGVSNSEEKNKPIVEGIVEEGIATVENQKQEYLENGRITENDPFVNTKVEEVIAGIQNIQDQNNTVTADEVEALLKKAQRDIATHRILNSSNFEVDATALLEDVETELERSFRNKVFDALGEGFDKVRTAVANRNN